MTHTLIHPLTLTHLLNSYEWASTEGRARNMQSLPSGGLQPSRADGQTNRPLQHSSGSQDGPQPSRACLPRSLLETHHLGAYLRPTRKRIETVGGFQHLCVNKPSRFEKHHVGEQRH